MPDDRGQWDLFISYASENREEIRPLVGVLARFGLKVWWDQFELRVGDSLSRTIDRGIAGSRFGAVVISQAFLSKRWPEYELRGLTAMEIGGDGGVLPIWWDVDFVDVVKYSPALADKRALQGGASGSEDQLLDLALALIEVANPGLFDAIHRRATAPDGVTIINSAGMALDLPIPPRRHDSLPSELLGRVRLIRAALMGVRPMSLERWIDGFQRDMNPTREIGIWERIAAAYLESKIFLKNPTVAERQAVLECLVRCTTDGPEAAEAALPESLRGLAHVFTGLVDRTVPIVDVIDAIDMKAFEAENRHNRDPFPIEMRENLSGYFPVDLIERVRMRIDTRPDGG